MKKKGKLRMCNQNSNFQSMSNNQEDVEGRYLAPDEVVSISKEDVKRSSMIPNENFTKFQLEEKALSEIWRTSFATNVNQKIDAKVLSPGKNWQKGKIKIEFECNIRFEPEED